MNKKQKTILTSYQLRKLIDLYKKENGKKYELDSDIDWYVNHHDFTVEEAEEYALATGMTREMVSFYDDNHEKLFSNWIGNSDLSQYSWVGDFRGYGQWASEWGIALPLSYYYNVDLIHLTWNQVWDLHKVRYIRIGERVSTDSYAYKETGLEIEVHTGKVARYQHVHRGGEPEEPRQRKPRNRQPA